ncbi:SAM-dependent methyltransferase [Leptolyngbya sp. FACHB-711]|uniref:SAM-dependent methyltransferase n=1 Tax=unclassified Leptolyngbya TaxID=2650499 RepID=UPI001689C0FC|nr:SAM-dependent methyltransferase [Leptolyngbya sp. FACHB-711]MBD2027241.1 SAM-dependent methyltransferase [Leptolyngbya sp. FACHB-711]
MAMELDQVVPFGRSLDEYIHLFNLSDRDLQKSMLGIGDGPASFNAEGTAKGYNIHSIDPIYIFSAEQIQQRVLAVVDGIIDQIKATPKDWVWTYHRSPNDLKQHRLQVAARFCADFETGKAEHRYTPGALPRLNAEDGQYELGLCSHFLFLYSDQFDTDFHLRSIAEMLRVCHEVRIFPLLTLMLHPSPHLQPVLETLAAQGYRCEIQQVSYELQKGGNQMLKITRP